MITCPSCGIDNPDDSKFCTGCGGPLAPAPGTATGPEAACAACGAANPSDSRFCVNCGAALMPPAPEVAGACAGCGAAVPADSKFCVSCGRPVAPAAPPEPAPSPFCTNCGAKLEPGTRFCTGCGAPAAGSGTHGTPQVPGSGQAPAGNLDAAYSGFLTVISGRLTQAGFEAVPQAPGLDADRAFKRQRFDLAKAGKVTTLCAVKWSAGPLTADAVRLWSLGVFNFASTQKALLGRSSLQPLVVYPVLISPACPPDVQAFLDSHWPKRVQAYEYPVVVALGTREMFCHRSTPVWGLAFHGGIKHEAETLFTP